ncbi:Uncharacterised protein [Mycobacteroides abscessus subsp. abscessus]|nr:Uncharacterised protein [Mycobacteroides abscessus subsp. abscessus]
MNSKSASNLARKLGTISYLMTWATGFMLFAWICVVMWADSTDPSEVATRNSWAVYFFLTLALFVAVLVGRAYMRSTAKSLAEQEKAQATADRQAEYLRSQEAFRLTQLEQERQFELRRIQSAHDDAIQLKQSIPALLQSVGANLNVADQEFQRGAFSPFWAAIEEATMHLGAIAEGLQKFEVLIAQHKEASAAVAARFNQQTPRFPVVLRDIYTVEDAQGLSQRMDTLVARAQTNYQFASIFEQRRTSAILIAGFQNLGSAISGMTARITSQLMDVVSAVDSASNAASGHSKEALDMLDNIQNRRMPFGYQGQY